jgi:hypothetical protein
VAPETAWQAPAQNRLLETDTFDVDIAAFLWGPGLASATVSQNRRHRELRGICENGHERGARRLPFRARTFEFVMRVDRHDGHFATVT